MFPKEYLSAFMLSLFIALVFVSGGERDLFVTHAEGGTSSHDIGLEEKLDKIKQDERLNGAIAGISVRNADTGREIYANDGDIRLHPASNMKILTAIAALEILGPDHQFSTSIFTDGKIVGDQLQGNVYIKGQGDPTLQKEDFDYFAAKLKEKGIKEIKGSLIGDDTWYDDVRLSQDLNWSDEPFHTGAQVSALTLSPNEDYDAGTILIEVSPSKQVGSSGEIIVTPNTDYVNLQNQTKTVQNGQRQDITIEREHGRNEIIVKGNIPVDSNPFQSWAAVWEPTKYALDVFKHALQNQGINVQNMSVKVGIVPNKAKQIVKKDSMPLKELLLPFMKLSNNGHAEVLVKEMGRTVFHEGSWDKGIDVMKQTLGKMGVNLNAIQIRDGSGMSHKNFVTASELTNLLHKVQDKEWYTDFYHSLPVAGEPERLEGGTLRYRLKEEPTKGNVFAKTGSITGVNTLSGYVTTVSGEKLIFSILFNNYVEEPITDIQDAIVKTLVTHN